MNIGIINPKGYLDSESWMPLGITRLGTLLKTKSKLPIEFYDEEIERVPATVLHGIDVLLLTGMSHQVDGIRRWARFAKRYGVERVVIGGVHATLMPEDFLNLDALVVSGPGEKLLDMIVSSKQKGLIKTSWSFDYDEFPWPNRQMFRWEAYNEKVNKLPAIRVVGAVGCPFSCHYCCNHSLIGRKVLYRDPKKVAEEIEESIRVLGIKAVVFAMPAFTMKKDWAYKMCDELERLKIVWKATTRVDLLDEPLIKRMKSAGCIALGFGVESGSNEILKILNKKTTVEQARKTFALCKKNDLDTWAMFMTHVPGETKKTLKETRAFAKEIDPILGCTFQRFSPLPGSYFWDNLSKWGKVVNGRGSGFGIKSFTPKDFL